MTVLRLGTRRSALATTQSTWVADRLRALGHEVELVEVSTEGDIDRTTPLAQLGGTQSSQGTSTAETTEPLLKQLTEALANVGKFVSAFRGGPGGAGGGGEK